MATYSLTNVTEAQLSTILDADQVDSRRAEVLTYLEAAGLFPTPASTIVLEQQTDSLNGPSIPVDPTAQFLTLTSNDVAVNTTSALKGIASTADNAYLFVRGGNDVVVTTKDGTNNHVYVDQGTGDVQALLGDGDDYLSGIGSTGTNTLDGGSGNDTLYAGGGATTMYGGGGNDIMSFATGSGTGVAYADGGTFNVIGDNNAVSNTLYGGTGADSLFAAGTGNDSLVAGSAAGGSNYLEARGTGTSHNTLVGGAGDDLLFSFSANGDDMFGGTGTTSMSYMAGSGSGTATSGSQVGGLNVIGDTNSANNTLIGGAGADSIYATGSGDDRLETGTGSQLLSAGDGGAGSSTGNNTLVSQGGGINTLVAGLGDDTLDGSTNTNSTIFYSHSGADATMLGGTSSDSFQVSNAAIGAPGSNLQAITVDVGDGTATDYVGFQNRASTDLAAPIGAPTTGGGNSTFTLTFTDGQTVTVTGDTGSGAHVELIFTDGTIKPTF